MILANPVVRYTLARLGLLVVVFLALLPAPGPSLAVKGMLAVVIALPLAWLLLRRWRDQASVALAESSRRRQEERERLRAALSGTDAPEPPDSADSPEGEDPPRR